MFWLGSGGLRWVWWSYWWYSRKCNTTANKLARFITSLYTPTLSYNIVGPHSTCGEFLWRSGDALGYGTPLSTSTVYEIVSLDVLLRVLCTSYIHVDALYSTLYVSGEKLHNTCVEIAAYFPQDFLHMSLIRAQTLWKAVCIFLNDYF